MSHCRARDTCVERFWFGLACELRSDWRNDIEGLGTLFFNHIPNCRNLINSYSMLAAGK